MDRVGRFGRPAATLAALSTCEHRKDGGDRVSVALSSKAAAWEVGKQRVARIPSALCCGCRIAMDRLPQ